MASSKRLSVRMNGHHVGVLEQHETGLLGFSYADSWREAADAIPLSLALPLAGGPYDDRASKAFFGGYLPEDPDARRMIGQRFHVSRNSEFALLSVLGRDCPGALSLLPLAADEPELPAEPSEPTYRSLSERELADELRQLETKPLLAGPDGLRLSLAGAQSKTALYVTNDGQIAMPEEDYPTTHILKPQLAKAYPDLARNEYVCMRLAQSLGLETPNVDLRFAEEIPFLMIERYDRVRDDAGRITRLHQEDFCQALGIQSGNKYQAADGPDFERCFKDVVDRLSEPVRDRLRLRDTVILNYLIGDSDAHGKNFSVLHAQTGIRLAPLYDVVCALVYPKVDKKMAMKIGGIYDPNDVYPRHWDRFADEVGLSRPALRRQIDDMSERLLIESDKMRIELAGIVTPIVTEVFATIRQRCERTRKDFEFGKLRQKKRVGKRERAETGDGPPAKRHPATEAEYEEHYFTEMRQIRTKRREARRRQTSQEEFRLAKEVRTLQGAFLSWRAGRKLDPNEAAILHERLGPSTTPPRGNLKGTARLHTDRATGQELTRAESSALHAAQLQYPSVVFLGAVARGSPDLVEHFVRKTGPLRDALRYPPRWRQGGGDLDAGTDVDNVDGNTLRVASRGHGAIEVSRFGTIGVSFSLNTSKVRSNRANASQEQVGGLELAERIALFVELVDELGDELRRESLGSRAEFEFVLRMRQLHASEPQLVMGPYIPRMMGWKFEDGLRSAAADEVLGETRGALPLDVERLAYELLRNVYLGFGVAMDDLPYVIDRDGAFVLDREAFLGYVMGLAPE